MAKLKYWLKRLRCWLTGCKLSSTGITSCRDEELQIMTFHNLCVRCGQEYKAVIPIKDLLDHQTIRLEVADGGLRNLRKRTKTLPPPGNANKY